ncbi:MAG: response regulator [Candidatus Delongbacteria bacterium]|nr:response regulator [Candidatus Delongbacteria bacterium]
MNEKRECKVLLVEDNPDHALIAKMTLKKLDRISKVDHVVDGQKALNYLFDLDSSAKVLPNLTILDLNLPEVNGFEVLKEIRNHENISQLPVVVLTTSEHESDVSKAINLGVIEYLIKPLDHEKLSEILDSIDRVKNLKNKSLEELNCKRIISICCHCQKIRNQKGLWELFDKKYSDDIKVEFSHSVCPECLEKHYKNHLN